MPPKKYWSKQKNLIGCVRLTNYSMGQNDQFRLVTTNGWLQPF